MRPSKLSITVRLQHNDSLSLFLQIQIWYFDALVFTAWWETKSCFFKKKKFFSNQEKPGDFKNNPGFGRYWYISEIQISANL